MMWGWQAWSWWGWLAMSVGMIAFWGLVIWAIAAIFRGSDWTWRRPERPTPEQILAERFAAGEIDEDEYQRRLETYAPRANTPGSGNADLGERTTEEVIGNARHGQRHHRAAAPLLGQARPPLRPADAILRPQAVRQQPSLDLPAGQRSGPGGRDRHRPEPGLLSRRHPADRRRPQPRHAGARPRPGRHTGPRRGPAGGRRAGAGLPRQLLRHGGLHLLAVRHPRRPPSRRRDAPGARRAAAASRPHRRVGLADPGRPVAAGAGHHPAGRRALPPPPTGTRACARVPGRAAGAVQARDRRAAGGPQASHHPDWVRPVGAQAETVGQETPAPVRALVVDDEPPLVRLVTSYLERDGFQAQSAGDGEQAVELAVAGPVRRLGDLVVDPAAREVRLAGRPVELTRLEFDLLEALSERPRVVLSRRQLLERVWGPDWYGDDHLVDVHIANLRRKLGDDPRAPRHILTVRGVGYRMGQAT